MGKPTGSLLFDVANYIIQACLLIENEETIKGRGSGKLHNLFAGGVMLCNVIEFSLNMAKAAFGISGGWIGYSLGGLAGLGIAMGGAAHFQNAPVVWQRVFIILTILAGFLS